MTRVIRAELIRLLRPRTLVAAGIGSVLYALVAALTVLPSAEGNEVASRAGGATLADLEAAGGGTEAFAVAASFVGFFVFVLFIALMAGEFSGGTLRALLLREPNRVRLVVGKLAGGLLVAAAVVAACELATFVASVALAPSQDIATGEWWSFGGLTAGLADYVTALGGVAGWAVFATMLGVVFRSVPLALGVGFAWAGPFENIVVDSWDTGFRVFPGQVLGSLIRGGTAELAMGRAVATAAVYVALAAGVALYLVHRRDVTS
jgi:ABC-type transport system involved in multi-copper enzyme maturation permease subunit